jgi:iron complex transport system substrate-binding protein
MKMKTNTTKQIFKLVLLAALAVLLLAACSPAEEAAETAAPPIAEVQPTATESIEATFPLTFVDGMGREITLDAYPERIVTTSPSIAEMLFAIGAGDLVVGRDDFSIFPEAILDVPSFGSLFSDFPAETILGMEPDLVIAAQVISADQVQMMEDLGLTVYWQANPATFDELYENISSIAALVGHEEEAATLNADLQARVGAVAEAVAAAETQPVVFYELDATDPSNPWTSGSGTFIDLIITSAGGVNAAAGLDGSFAQISVEALIVQNPAFIILGDADFGGVTAEAVAARGGWDSILAVANGDIYPVDSNWFSVPGPRLIDGLELMARSHDETKPVFLCPSAGGLAPGLGPQRGPWRGEYSPQGCGGYPRGASVGG